MSRLLPYNVKSSFGDGANEFYAALETPVVPRAAEVMNPYTEPVVQGYLRTFLDKYFGDDRGRIPIIHGQVKASTGDVAQARRMVTLLGNGLRYVAGRR